MRVGLGIPNVLRQADGVCASFSRSRELGKAGSSVEDESGRIYTYDGENGGELEVFSGTTGLHIGVAHVMTGEFIKPAKRGRKIDVS